MKINKLINGYGMYGPFHSQGFVNHLPMAQYALYDLGATEAQIIRFADDYVKKFNLAISSEVIKIEDWTSHLGHREAYAGYVHYFKDKIEKESLETVVKETLNVLLLGIGSALFHGLIRISYAITLGDLDEVSRALALLACCYQKIEFSGTVIRAENMNVEIYRYISEREGLFYLESTTENKEKTMINSFVELYLSTGSFIVLHTITGLEALINLKLYFEDYEHVLDVYMISVLRALLRVTDKEYKKIVLNQQHSWSTISEITCDLINAHTIKFVYSCQVLNELYPNDNLRIASQIKLKLDHDR